MRAQVRQGDMEGGVVMNDYGTPHVNRIESVPGKFRIWTDQFDQKTSRIVTRNGLILLKVKIEEALKADEKAAAEAASGKVVA